ncbi:MAG: CpaF family protein [Rhodospirillaceae bacterium]|nr:CpaF family protein [Rhodospirillales bacterium]
MTSGSKRPGLIPTDARWSSETELVTFIRQVANALGQEVDEQRRPLLDARLEDGTRLNATLRPIAVFGPCVSIRPFPKRVFDLDDLLRLGAVTADMLEIFRVAVTARLNVLVSGGTGSGKTTLLRCFCRFVPEDERTITIEDTAENLLPDHPHRLSFEAPKRRQGDGMTWSPWGC